MIRITSYYFSHSSYSMLFHMGYVFCVSIHLCFEPVRAPQDRTSGRSPKILPCYYTDIFMLNDSSHHAHAGKITLIFIDRILFVLLIIYSFGLLFPLSIHPFWHFASGYSVYKRVSSSVFFSIVSGSLHYTTMD